MNIKTFIDRPIFAGVISVMILLLGLMAMIMFNDIIRIITG